jgi:hypothetical protein
MVVKLLDFIVRGRRGLTPPAVKCRGTEYLRIIYGNCSGIIIEIAIVLTTPVRLCSVSDSWKLCEPRNLGSLAIAGSFYR